MVSQPHLIYSLQWWNAHRLHAGAHEERCRQRPKQRHEQYARSRLPALGLMIAILKSSPTSMVALQHSDACIRQPCEVGNGPAEGLQSHPSSQLFVASDVHQFRHGLAHVRWVATPNGPKKNAVLTRSQVTG